MTVERAATRVARIAEVAGALVILGKSRRNFLILSPAISTIGALGKNKILSGQIVCESVEINGKSSLWENSSRWPYLGQPRRKP